MTIMARIIFFAIFFGVLGLISFYVFIRGLQSIPQDSSLRGAYIIAFWTIALSFMGGRLLESIWPSILSDLLVWMGSFWLAALLYFLLAVVALDFLRLVNHFLPIFPVAIADHYAQAKYIASASVIGIVSLLVLAGHINSLMPRLTTLNLSIAKKARGPKSLNIVAASDVHLGTIVGRSRVDHIVARINDLNPDLVLLPGDILDEDVARAMKQNIGEALRNIKARYGVYAVTGNHEYIGGVEEACAYLIEHNVVMLRDSVIKVGDSFYLVGREDRSKNWRGESRRKDLSEIMASVDKNFPVILMDHQPFGLEEGASNGADLQLSGHTHDGQLWPVSYIVHAIYELAMGYKLIGRTHVYVSNGVGTWGPPVRIGNRPEILQIRLNFE